MPSLVGVNSCLNINQPRVSTANEVSRLMFRLSEESFVTLADKNRTQAELVDLLKSGRIKISEDKQSFSINGQGFFSFKNLANLKISYQNNEFKYQKFEQGLVTQDQRMSVTQTNIDMSSILSPKVRQYLDKQTEILKLCPSNQRDKLQQLFNIRAGNLRLQANIKSDSFEAELAKCERELESFQNLFNAPFVPEKLMKLGGAAKEEIEAAKVKFQAVKENTIGLIIQEKLKTLNQLSKPTDKVFSLGFDGKEKPAVLGADDTFVAINQDGEFNVSWDGEEAAFCATYAKDYLYLIQESPHNTEALVAQLKSSTTESHFNGLAFSKQGFLDLANSSGIFNFLGAAQTSFLNSLPKTGTFELIPYSFMSRINPEIRFSQVLVGVKTENGYQIFNPLSKSYQPEVIGKDKTEAIEQIKNTKFGAGRLFVANGDKLKAFTTNRSIDDSIYQVNKFINHPAFIAVGVASSLASLGTNYFLKGAQGATKALVTANALATRGFAYSFGTMAGIDLGQTFNTALHADLNEEQKALLIRKAVTDISVMTLTLLPGAKGNIGQKLMDIKIGAMSVLNADSLLYISSIANNSNLEPKVKAEKIGGTILLQAFFNALLLGNIQQAKTIATQPDLVKELASHGTTPEVLMNAPAEQVKAFQGEIIELYKNSKGTFEVKKNTQNNEAPATITDINKFKEAMRKQVPDSTLETIKLRITALKSAFPNPETTPEIYLRFMSQLEEVVNALEYQGAVNVRRVVGDEIEVQENSNFSVGNSSQEFDIFMRSLESDPDILYRSSGREIKTGEGIQIGDKEGMQVSTGNIFNIPREYIGKYDGDDKGIPSMESKYLWALDKDGLKVVREDTKFKPAIKRKTVSHTNLTGGGNAYSAGEVWFINDNTVYLNAGSAAYGENHKPNPISNYEYKKAIEAWELAGYKVIKVPIDERFLTPKGD